MTLIYGSVCSGIEAASVAWATLGWQAAFVSEIDAAPRAVLTHRYPQVPLHGDFTTIRAGEFPAIDLLVGGTPCQSFSVAGLRGGLADDRGNLALQYLRLADRLRPRWLVWENVPGVLSSNGGRDFGAILGGMVELGYGFAYRVLDAQYVRVDGYGRAVAQRRRRVFVVGYLGDWRRPAAVLLERACLRGDPAPRREAGARIASALTSSLGGGRGGGPRGADDNSAQANHLVAGTLCSNRKAAGSATSQDAQNGMLVAFQATGDGYWREGIGPLATSDDNGSNQILAFSCKDHGADATDEGVTPTLRAMGFDRSHANAGGQLAVAIGFNGRQDPISAVERTGPLDTDELTQCVAYGIRADASRDGSAKTPSADAEGRVRLRDPGLGIYDGLAPTLDAGQPHTVASGWSVRRLTPTECERLQGFPDGWTAVPWRGGAMPDGPRYKMLGNSMAVNVMRWIGRRIEMVEAISASAVLQAAE